jgi:hypothetical protein
MTHKTCEAGLARLARLVVVGAVMLAGVGGCSSKIEKATTMHPNGTLASRFSYYVDENEKPVYQGKMEKFYENGVLESSRTYVNGKVEGRAMFYMRDRETMYLTFKDNEANGPVEILYPSGKRRLRGECRNGRFHGNFVFWDEDGNKVGEGVYQNGTPYTGTFVIRGNVVTYDKGRVVKSEPLAKAKQP